MGAFITQSATSNKDRLLHHSVNYPYLLNTTRGDVLYQLGK